MAIDDTTSSAPSPPPNGTAVGVDLLDVLVRGLEAARRGIAAQESLDDSSEVFCGFAYGSPGTFCPFAYWNSATLAQ